MSTAPTEVRHKAPRAKNQGPQSANTIERSALRAMWEAAAAGCGSELRRAMTAEAAYYRAERRRFEPGHELEDWLAAEGEIQRLWTRTLQEEGPLPCGY